MDNEQRKELISQFTSITGVPEERATFYLESSGWMLEVAMASFYDYNEESRGDDDDDDVAVIEPEDPVRDEPPQSKNHSQPTARFGTISALHQDSDSDEEGQAFYAGGAEHGGSGEVVIGPGKKKSGKYVESLFEAARQHGAEIAEDEAGSTAGSSSFQGAGYRLGMAEGQSEVVNKNPVIPKPKQVDFVLKLWKNGFSIDNESLRSYDDPANKEFLDSVHKGEVPAELERMARGGEVNLNMEDHRNEEFAPQKKTVKAFSGTGHMLGSPAPSVVPSPRSSSEKVSDLQTASSGIHLDTSQPLTNIQIRLIDGTRLVQKFNHSHTIGDIRSFINRARPDLSSLPYTLMTTFPNKDLIEDSLQIKEASLLNAVIVQRKRS